MINKTNSPYRAFLAILDDKDLGNMKMIYNSKVKSGINQPVLLESHTRDYSSYDPGYLDLNGNFYGCPICVYYVQINKIIQYKVGRKEFEIDISIFGKDLNEYRNEVFKVFTNTREVASIINDINIFIHGNYLLDRLEIKRVFPSRRNAIPELVTIPAISKLEFTFYENSHYVLAKDNIFWEEIEVRNVAMDTYISSLIVEGLKKQCWTLENTEYGLIMTLNKHRLALPDYERRKIENTSDIDERTNLLKGRLLIEVMANFDSNDYMCHLMMIH